MRCMWAYRKQNSGHTLCMQQDYKLVWVMARIWFLCILPYALHVLHVFPNYQGSQQGVLVENILVSNNMFKILVWPIYKGWRCDMLISNNRWLGSCCLRSFFWPLEVGVKYDSMWTCNTMFTKWTHFVCHVCKVTQFV